MQQPWQKTLPRKGPVDFKKPGEKWINPANRDVKAKKDPEVWTAEDEAEGNLRLWVLVISAVIGGTLYFYPSWLLASMIMLTLIPGAAALWTRKSKNPKARAWVEESYAKWVIIVPPLLSSIGLFMCLIIVLATLNVDGAAEWWFDNKGPSTRTVSSGGGDAFTFLAVIILSALVGSAVLSQYMLVLLFLPLSASIHAAPKWAQAALTSRCEKRETNSLN